MKKLIYSAAFILACGTVLAGNPDRIGQAGATQLNINGWGQSSGWGWAGVAGARGIESIYLNVGGMARTSGTQVGFTRTNWLRGTDININTFGVTQTLGGGDNSLGLAISSIDFGQIPITTVEQPEGGLGTFSPRFTNISLAFAHKFTPTISGGMVVKTYSESITNAKAQGVALDAGISYVTDSKRDDAKENDIKFGISLKNVGPDGSYSGDGLSFKAANNLFPTSDEQTLAIRTQRFNLPTLINIGGSYDFQLDKDKAVYFNRLTTAFTFTSNAFSRNQFTVGAEYAYKEMIMVRAGYAYEQGITSRETATTIFTGVSAGLTFEVPFGKETNNKFALDYSFRHTYFTEGTHSFGVRVTLD